MEAHLGGVPHAEPPAQLPADEARGLGETLQRARALVGVAEDPDLHAHGAQVGRDLRPGHGHETHPRVLQRGYDARDLLPDLLRQPLGPPSHKISVWASSTWISRAW